LENQKSIIWDNDTAIKMKKENPSEYRINKAFFPKLPGIAKLSCYTPSELESIDEEIDDADINDSSEKTIKPC